MTTRKTDGGLHAAGRDGSSAAGRDNASVSGRERLDLSDEAITLAYSYYFTWGYPDYMREALKLTTARGGFCDQMGIDHKKDVSWKQLRQVIEEADSSRVRYIVAGDPKTPQPILNFLAGDKDSLIAQRVAENINAHPCTLVRLAKHGCESVRMAICENRSVPEPVLLMLTQDDSADVRYLLAENMNAPQSVLEALTQDGNPYVSARAERSLNVLRPATVLAPDFGRVARRGKKAAVSLS